MSIDELNLALLIGAAVLITAIAAVRLSARTNFPTLLLYLGLGLLIGEGGLGVEFEDAELAGVLGYAALVLILAEGGLTTRWESVRESIAPAAVLATLGTIVSIAVTGAAAVLILKLDWTLGLLVGAVLASTDAAAVFSVLRRVPLPHRLGGILEAESGFNDAPVVIAVIALTQAVSHRSETHPFWYYVLEAGFELVVGAVIGLAVGWLGATGLRRVGLPSSGLYPIAVIGLIVLSYGGAAVVGASGFLATYLASLVLGNMRLPHGSTVRGFAEGLGWMAQIGLFVLLGLLASPSRLWGQAPLAIGVGLVLLLVARPLSVVVSVSWFRLPWRDQAFLSWAGLRGAVPIVLATVPMAASVKGSEEIFDLVFVLVVVFTLVQAPTLPFVARVLRVSDPEHLRELDVDVSPLGAISADVLQVRIGPGSQMHGIEIFELRLPPGVNVTLILREGQSIVPSRRTVLQHGDDLVVVAPTHLRRETEARLRTVHAEGKLARWRAPQAPVTVEAAAAERSRVRRRRSALGALGRVTGRATGRGPGGGSPTPRKGP